MAARKSVRGEWLAFYLAEIDPDNPHIKRFARRLKVKWITAAGMYYAVVGYMWKHERHGDLEIVPAEDLESAAQWDGKPGEMYAAFLETFNDLLWEQTWEARTKGYKGIERSRGSERERKAAYRATKEKEAGVRDDIPPATKPVFSSEMSQPVSHLCPRHQPTDQRTDGQTEGKTDTAPVAALTEQQRRELAKAVGSVGGSFSTKDKQQQQQRHPALRAVERTAVMLGLTAVQATTFTAGLEGKLKERGPLKQQWILEPLALVAYVCSRADIVEKMEYLDGCELRPRDKWVKKVKPVFEAEFLKEGDP